MPDTERDFASFLDAAPRPDIEDREVGAGPAMPFAFIGEIGAQGATQPARSGFAAAAYGAFLVGEQGVEPLPDITPEAVARELGLTRSMTQPALARLRRDFAFRNHPDRVRPEWRESAIVRMQIANRMIDEARRRVAPRD